MTRQLEGLTFSLLAASKNLKQQIPKIKFKNMKNFQSQTEDISRRKTKLYADLILHFRRWFPSPYFIATNNNREGFLPAYKGK